MRFVLFAVVLISLILCQPHHEMNKEERLKRKKEFQKELVECILNNGTISAELKKQVEDNKEEDLRKILHLFTEKLESTDREVIRQCRRQLFTKMREAIRSRFNHGNGTFFEGRHHHGEHKIE